MAKTLNQGLESLTPHFYVTFNSTAVQQWQITWHFVNSPSVHSSD